MSIPEIVWQGPNHRLVLSDGQYGWQEWVKWNAMGDGVWRACEETDLMAELRRRILDERTPARPSAGDGGAKCTSPFTREEFVQAETERAGIDVDTPLGTIIHKIPDSIYGKFTRAYAHTLADAAERAGVVWRTGEPAGEPATQPTGTPEGNDGPSEETAFGTPGEHSLGEYAQRVTGQLRLDPIESEHWLERAVNRAARERTADSVTPAERLDSMEVAIRQIQRDAIGTRGRVTDLECGEYARRIAEVEVALGSTGHGGDWLRREIKRTVAATDPIVLDRLTALEQTVKAPPQFVSWPKSDLDALLNRVNDLELEVKKRALLWVEEGVKSANSEVRRHGDLLFDLRAGLSNLELTVRRLDSDMALVRDAVCPPQGARTPLPEQGPAQRGMSGDGGPLADFPPHFLDWWEAQLVPGPAAGQLEIGKLKLSTDGANAVAIRNLCQRAWESALSWYNGGTLRDGDGD